MEQQEKYTKKVLKDLTEIISTPTIFMAGWLTGAYMKPMPHFSTQSPMA